MSVFASIWRLFARARELADALFSSAKREVKSFPGPWSGRQQGSTGREGAMLRHDADRRQAGCILRSRFAASISSSLVVTLQSIFHHAHLSRVAPASIAPSRAAFIGSASDRLIELKHSPAALPGLTSMASLVHSVREQLQYSWGYVQGRSFAFPHSISDVYGRLIAKATSLVSLPLPLLSFLALPLYGTYSCIHPRV